MTEATQQALEAALIASMASDDAAAAFDEFQARLLALDDRVRSGPFRGMRLLAEESWGHVASYLLGAYECELHDQLERLLATDYSCAVDVGCTEGYYAVGLALRLPRATVHAFDIDDEARRICGRLAEVNGVADRVVVRDGCGVARLQQVVMDRALVFVDCEGCELHLLDPSLVPALVDADLVVELHDFVDPTITTRVLERFAPTHDLELVDVSARDSADYIDLTAETGPVKFTTLYEFRPTEPHPMQWAVLRSRRW